MNYCISALWSFNICNFFERPIVIVLDIKCKSIFSGSFPYTNIQNYIAYPQNKN